MAFHNMFGLMTSLGHKLKYQLKVSLSSIDFLMSLTKSTMTVKSFQEALTKKFLLMRYAPTKLLKVSKPIKPLIFLTMCTLDHHN